MSDTGELRRDWEQGVYSIDTPRTQAAMGWIGGKQIKLADVEIAVTTRNATVAVQSLDERPISGHARDPDLARRAVGAEGRQPGAVPLRAGDGAPRHPRRARAQALPPARPCRATHARSPPATRTGATTSSWTAASPATG